MLRRALANIHVLQPAFLDAIARTLSIAGFGSTAITCRTCGASSGSMAPVPVPMSATVHAGFSSANMPSRWKVSPNHWAGLIPLGGMFAEEGFGGGFAFPQDGGQAMDVGFGHGIVFQVRFDQQPKFARRVLAASRSPRPPRFPFRKAGRRYSCPRGGRG